MRKILLTFGGALAVVIALVAAAAPQQDEDLKGQLAKLAKDQQAQAALIQAQDKKIKDLEARLSAMEAWTAGLPATVSMLENGLRETEAAGFTQAGANPRARETLLESLRGFGNGLKTNLPSRGNAAAK